MSREKSITHPTQVIEHVGFVLNSINMTLILPKEKIDTIIQLGSDILESKCCSIREAAKLIGTLVSCSPDVECGPSYKQLELEKMLPLKNTEGLLKLKYSFQSCLSQTTKSWQNIKPISHGNPDCTITTDAPLQGWGAC